MLAGGLRTSVSPSESLQLFVEWHELVEESKKSLGYAGARVSEQEGAGDKASPGAKGRRESDTVAAIDLAEREMLADERALEGSSALADVEAGRNLKRRVSVAAFSGATDTAIALGAVRAPQPLPKRAVAKLKWRKAYVAVKLGFLFREFGEHDEHDARLLEGRMGGSKFGMAAFSQLLWRHRLFVGTNAP